MKLDTLDLKASLAAVIKEGNPKFDMATAPSIILATPTALTGDVRNTSIKLYIDREGVYGYLSLKYDRLDLPKLLSSFGGVTRVPSIVVFYEPGTVVKISDVIAQLRAIFNIQFTLGTEYEDLTDGSVTIPAKGQTVDITLAIPSKSIRCIPGKSLTLRFANRGRSINETLASRNFNPIVGANTENCLNLASGYGIPLINVNGPVKELPALKFRYMNFTDILGGLSATSIVESIRVGDKNWDHYLKQSIFDAINARLTGLGFPVLANRKLVSNMISAAGYQSDSQAPEAATEFFNNTLRKNTANLPAQYVDTTNPYCLLITMAMGGMVETATSYAHDYFLQFK